MRKKITLLFAALVACVGVVKADVTDLPLITEDLENPIYYTIYNTRSGSSNDDRTYTNGGLIYYAGDNAGIKDGRASSTLDDVYKFYFTGSHDAMYIHNAATGNKLASVNSWTAEGAEWAMGISPKGGGLAIGPKGGLSGWNCINELNHSDGYTTWLADDAGSIFVVELVDNYVFPKTDLFYTIECPLFENAQGIQKGLYVDANGALGWNTVDLANKNFYWIPTVKDDGTIAFKNLGTQKYLNGTSVSESEATGTIKPLGANQFAININSTDIHANGHSNGNGESGSIVSWANNANTASGWRFVQRNDPDALLTAVVKYSFTYDNVEKYSQETTVLVGDEWPAISVSLPYGVTTNATTPDGNVSGDVTLTFELAIEKELPFETAENANSITTWYHARMHTNQPGYLGDIADDKTINVGWGKSSDVASDNYVWGFVGNVFDGIVVVNKGTGLQLTSTGSGNATLTDNGTPFFVARTSETSENATNGFCLRKSDSNQYLNANYSAGKLSHWSSTDAGSTFFLTEYVETEVAVSDVNWATMYLGYAAYIPDGVNVYTATGVEGGYVTLNQLEGVIPANTGVLLENVGTFTFKKAAKDPAAVAGNLLSGSTTDTYVEGDAYVLAKKNDVIGLYKAALNKNAEGAEGKTHFKNNANKAYLVVPAAEAGAAMFSLERGEGTTGIDQLLNADAELVIYDLAGRRVEKMEKGIYIVNGKKVIR